MHRDGTPRRHPLSRLPRTVVLLTLLTAALMPCASAEREHRRGASLLLNITVEGLSDASLEQLRHLFTDGGFELLMEQGVAIEDLDYGAAGIDAVAATSILSTGARAESTGIAGGTDFDPVRRMAVPVLTREGKPTVKALPVSTLSDEVRVAHGGINHVYSIAPDARQALLLGGHAANAALWIDDVNGRWTTAAADYVDIPAAVSNRNFSRTLSSRLDTIKWTPLLGIERYPDLPSYKKSYPFRHVFPHSDPNRYRAFKASARANTEVTDVALDVIESMKLGTGDVTDMVSLAYTVAPSPYSKDADSRLEVMDAYVRLDRDLARLFAVVDTARTLIVVSGVPAPRTGKADDARFNIPSGVFSPRQALSLLNMYLMAQHGTGEWVVGAHERMVFLNHALIKERGLSPAAVRADAATFLLKMEGVSGTMTIDQVLADPALKRNVAIGTAGDIFLTVSPGWEIEIEADGAGVQQHRSEVSRYEVTTYPLYMLIPGRGAETITERVDAAAIAPTVSRLLRIRAPNGAASAPLKLR